MTSTEEKKQESRIRDNKGRFIKGISGHPGGRPLGATNKALTDIKNAIEEFEKENGVSYWKAATLIAMRLAQKDGNTSLLAKILDKFVPTQIQGEGFSDQNKITQIIINKLYKGELSDKVQSNRKADTSLRPANE